MIKILDKSLTPLCVLTKIKSLQWTKRFYDVGSFELYIPFTDENLKHIKSNFYITHGDKVGIIKYLEQTKTDVRICGYDLKGILKKRKCEGEKTGNAETVIKSYIDENLINAVNPRRNISNFINAANRNRGIEVTWKSEYSKLDIEINKIGMLAELGYDVTLIDDNFVFDVLEGIDRTTNQSDVPPVLFCKEFKNISDFDYVYDALTAYNTVYIGETEVYETEYTGMDREESIESLIVDEIEIEEIQTRGKTLLKENAIKENISAETNQSLEYKKDWNLGDYVTLKVDVFGETLLMDKQITEVLEVYERGNLLIKPTFGEVKDNIIKKLMR